METSVKEITATTFGWVIAFVLPGLLGLYTISLWSTKASAQLSAFANAESTIGLFFIVLLTTLLIGLELSAVRWLLFECLLCRKKKVQSNAFAKLRVPENFTAFRTIVDEHYKYHQFFGGLVPVIPVFFYGLARSQGVEVISFEAFGVGILALITEAVTVAGAIHSYGCYVDRANAIFGE